MHDEASLLERAKAYDPSALSEIYDRYSGRIHNYIYRRVGNVQLAEDLTAEVAVRALQHRALASLRRVLEREYV